MLRAIIIDDEPAGIDTLRLLIEKYTDNLRVVASTNEAEAGIKLIEDYRPDIVFLDINMPTMSGFELLEKVNHKEFKLVFTTAHKEYAIDAIKKKAFDYILKPINPQDLKRCIENLESEIDKKVYNNPQVKTETFPLMELAVRDGIIFAKPQDIIRLEASGSYTIFYLDGKIKHMVSKSLKEFESQLPTQFFCRCHHSHIVNLSKVVKFVNHEGFYAQMSDGSSVDISRRNKDLFLEKLKSI